MEAVPAELPAFAFIGVTKRFGKVIANQEVSFAVTARTIHGVVGENGAGKSTIMKMLYGLFAPDAGEIQVRGQARAFRGPDEAIRLGIGMVHQHFMLVPTFSVWRNVILGHEPGAILKADEICAELETLQRSFGFQLDLRARVEDLPVGHQQQVEILKLLYRRAEILILDEPTAVLTPQEVDAFFEKLRGLRDGGKTIVLISHKLREILRFTETVTVMRRGRVVETVATTTLTPDSLAEKIIGRKAPTLQIRASPPQQEIVRVRDLHVPSASRGAPKGLSFSVHAGEIVGIAGVEGNGQGELVEVLAGVRRDYQGDVEFLGKPLRERTTYAARQEGLALIPPDRHREAVVLDFSLQENMLLGHHRAPRFAKRGWYSTTRLAAATSEVLEAYDVRPRDPQQRLGALSGGNQQKLVVGRELAFPVKFLIAAHPTRGVDIGATHFIHDECLRLRQKGAAVLLISSELEEVLALADRILVLFEGRFTGETTRAQATEKQLGLWMTGGGA